jgi:hypothetical protein
MIAVAGDVLRHRNETFQASGHGEPFKPVLCSARKRKSVLFTKDGASLVVRIKTKMQIKMGPPAIYHSGLSRGWCVRLSGISQLSGSYQTRASVGGKA